MSERESFIGRKFKGVVEWGAEVSKKVDKYLIALGAGIYVLINSAVGAAIVIGSVITMLPADAIQRWARKGHTSANSS